MEEGVMKKYLFTALVLLLLSVCLCTWSYAQTTNVANTSKRGSLLIFPEIRTDIIDVGTYRTLVTISNDYPGEVDLQCCYVISGCTPICGGGHLTASQPLTIDAATGALLDPDGFETEGYLPALGHNTKAELKCWAVGEDSGGDTVAISWNYLAGEATIVNTGRPDAYTYNAWRFKAYAPFSVDAPHVGVGTKVPPSGGSLGYVSADFSGLAGQYDACPKYSYFDILQPSSTVEDYVSLVPCKQDLTQDGGPTRIKVDLSIWNEKGEAKSLLTKWLCIDCFFQGSLATSLYDGGGPTAFPTLGTPGGYFKTTTVAGGKTDVCPFTLSAGEAPPVLGVIDKRWVFGAGAAAAATSSTTPTISDVGAPVTGALKYNYNTNY
jgi:hypothetical protein